jgi:hypothetical protein
MVRNFPTEKNAPVNRLCRGHVEFMHSILILAECKINIHPKQFA